MDLIATCFHCRFTVSLGGI